MGEKVVIAIVGALVGASLTCPVNFYLARLKEWSDYKRQAALVVLGYLRRTIYREPPESLKEKVPELRNEWAVLVRELPYFNVRRELIRDMDSTMINYLDALEELGERPDRIVEVDRKRELAVEESFRFMRAFDL